MKNKRLNIVKDIMKLTAPQLINLARYLFARKHHRSNICLNYAPISISIVVSGECNFNCKMCLTHSPLNPPKGFKNRQNSCDMINFEYFKKVIDQLKCALSLSLIGAGEPFLNPELFRMIEYASIRRRMKVHVVSNGSLIDGKVDNILNSSLTNLCISINSESRNEFERMTGNDPRQYDIVLENTFKLTKRKKALDTNTIINLSFIIDKLNYKKIPQMIKLSEDLGVDGISFNNFLPLPYAGFMPEERCLFAEDEEVFSTLKGFKNKIKTNLAVHYPTLLANYNSQPYCCDTFIKQIRIDGSGYYGSCSVMQLNNNRGDDLFQGRKSFNSAYFQQMRRLFIEQRKSDLHESCRYCTQNVGIRI